jgi:triosephosphate isomerase
MSSKKIVIGNWKMNPTSKKEAISIFENIKKNSLKFRKTDIAICPPFVFLPLLEKIKTTKVKLGSQNFHTEEKGSFTGETSLKMLENFNIFYSIIGHSERRAMGEDNSLINRKIKLALKEKITPILCFGEKNRDENGEYLNVLKNQIEESLTGVNKKEIENIIFAYEPVWAIGKDATREATPEEFNEVAIFTKRILLDKFGIKNPPRIIYGGSVNPKNALGFLQVGAQGFLVGRDSLDPKKFLEIIAFAEISK